MKKHLLIFLVLFSYISGVSQCVIQEISTNPENPVNEQFVDHIAEFFDNQTINYSHNPYLNTGFDWYPSQTNSTLNFLTGVTQNMGNPFTTAHIAPSYSYLLPSGSSTANPKEYRWEDGWELMYLNSGYFPDGNPYNGQPLGSPYNPNGTHLPVQASNPNIPYFVLYNRYRGLLRIFARYDGGDVWDDAMHVSLGLWDNSKNGVLRHANRIDRPLDQKTETEKIQSAKAPPTSGATSWFMADLQMGYDPCSCKRDSRFVIKFVATDIIAIDIEGRSVSINDAVNNSNYTQRDFFNFDSQNEVGSRVYTIMDSLYKEYEDKLSDYNSTLLDFKSPSTTLKKTALSAVKTTLANGNVTLSTETAKLLIDAATQLGLPGDLSQKNIAKTMESAGKTLLSNHYDFLSAQLFQIPKDPGSAPTIPVATFEESSFKGTLTDQDEQSTGLLFVPGTLPNAFNSVLISDITPHAFPAYNKPLGLFAMTESPKIIFGIDYSKTIETFEVESDDEKGNYPGVSSPWLHEVGFPEIIDSVTLKHEIFVKLDEPLKFALNNSVDFDEDKTKIYAKFIVELEDELDSAFLSSNWKEAGILEVIDSTEHFLPNLRIEHYFPNSPQNGDGHKAVLQTKWSDVTNFGQKVFKAEVDRKAWYVKERELLNGQNLVLFFIDQVSPIEFEQKGDLNIKSIKLRIMADMYFEQLGSDEEQINTTQVFTYLVYDNERQENPNATEIVVEDQELPYLPGTVILDEHSEINGSHEAIFDAIGVNLILKAENFWIKEDGLNVGPLAKATLIAQNEIHIDPNAEINPDVLMEIEPLQYVFGASFPVGQDYIESYCNEENGAYQADHLVASKKDNVDSELEIESSNDQMEEGIELTVYPNPTARNEIFLDISNVSSKSTGVVTVVDNYGKLVLQENIDVYNNSKYRIDISLISSGIYHLQLRTDQSPTIIKTFIKN